MVAEAQREVRDLTESDKKTIAGSQMFRCANSPGSNVVGYDCPMWELHAGNFDVSGYDIDHIIELADGGNNDTSNLQALCPCCHRVKTSASARARRKRPRRDAQDSARKDEVIKPSFTPLLEKRPDTSSPILLITANLSSSSSNAG